VWPAPVPASAQPVPARPWRGAGHLEPDPSRASGSFRRPVAQGQGNLHAHLRGAGGEAHANLKAMARFERSRS
jgi:hypothetical protein